MSNKVIVLWGSIIIILLLSIYLIGVNYKKEIKYIELKNYVKESVNDYIMDNDVEIPFSITSETLEEKGYIMDLVLDDKICAADINVSKILFLKRYKIEFTCINKTLD